MRSFARTVGILQHVIMQRFAPSRVAAGVLGTGCDRADFRYDSEAQPAESEVPSTMSLAPRRIAYLSLQAVVAKIPAN